MRVKKMVGGIAAPLRARLPRQRGMLPTFLVIGTKRGGSTSLYEWITRHPSIAPSRARKGSHYFDVNHTRGFDWFRSLFEAESPTQTITGEASPYYMFHPLALERIKAELPEAKLIVALRNPATRAWSHYQYEKARGHENLSFVDALDREDERLAGEEERLREDPSYQSAEHRHHTYLRRGHYAEQLTKVLELFPAEQLLVIQSEALFEDPNRELTRVWDYLGLPHVHLEGLRAHKAGSYDQVPPEIAARLEAYYEPLNAQLYALPQITFRWPIGDARQKETGEGLVPA